MKRSFVIKEALVALIALFPIAYLAINWNLLPDSVPVHFDLNGEPNGYGSKWTYMILPLGIYFLMLILPKIDPRKTNYKLFDSTYYKLRLLLGLLMGMLSFVTIYSMLHTDFNYRKFLPMILMASFALFGNYMGTIRPNYFVGFKVPWTLNSDVVWVKTHRLAGKLWFWGGILGMVVLFFLPKPHLVLIPMIGVLVIVPTVYSYVIYQKISKSE